MGRRDIQPRKQTRKLKVEAQMKPEIKARFVQEDNEGIPESSGAKFVPSTHNQKRAVGLLRSGCRVLFLQGSAGVGKSMLAAWWASELIKSKKVENIFLIRPNVSTGKSGGSLPGSETEKLAPFFAQSLIHLEKFLGKGFLKYLMEKEQIQFKSAEFLRGRSLEDCCAIIDEVQNFTASEFECVLTRLGKNSTFIFCGDHKQNDLRGQSGLMDTIKLLNRMVEDQPEYLADEDIDAIDSLVGCVAFTPDDCVRDPLTKAFVKMYYNN